MKVNGYNYLAKYVDSIQALGRYTFSYDDLETHFDLGYDPLRKALNRLSKKKRIVLVRDKFYVIVPPEYRNRGILPAYFFIHDLMAYLKKPYYVSLLSAAALQGAAHQQPQVFQVMTMKPTRRPIHVKGLQINFYFKFKMPKYGLMQHKTDTGYIWASNAALTAVDLLMFERRIGGLARAVALLDELSENIDVDQLRNVMKNEVPSAVLQRLGFLLDRVLNLDILSESINDELQKRKLFRVPLDPASYKTGKPVDRKWKVFENVDLEGVL